MPDWRQGSAVPVAEKSASDNEAGSQRSAVLTGTQIRETTAEKGHCAVHDFRPLPCVQTVLTELREAW